MKPTILVITISVLIALSSCQNRPSPEEQQRTQQLHDDSVKQAAILERQQEEAKEAEKIKLAEDKETLTRMIASLDADLQAEETKMQSVQTFHLLRTSDEKAEQVRQQALSINDIKLQIEKVKEQLGKLENGLEYIIPQ